MDHENVSWFFKKNGHLSKFVDFYDVVDIFHLALGAVVDYFRNSISVDLTFCRFRNVKFMFNRNSRR